MSEGMTARSLRPAALTFVVINGEPMSYGYSTTDDPPRVPFKSTLSKQQMDGGKWIRVRFVEVKPAPPRKRGKK